MSEALAATEAKGAQHAADAGVQHVAVLKERAWTKLQQMPLMVSSLEHAAAPASPPPQGDSWQLSVPPQHALAPLGGPGQEGRLLEAQQEGGARSACQLGLGAPSQVAQQACAPSAGDAPADTGLAPLPVLLTNMRLCGLRLGKPLCEGGQGTVYPVEVAALAQHGLLLLKKSKELTTLVQFFAERDIVTAAAACSRFVLPFLAAELTPALGEDPMLAVVGSAATGVGGRPPCAEGTARFLMPRASATLSDLFVRVYPLPASAVQLCIADLVCALEAVAAVGAVHRDVKLANVGRADSGELRLFDFGGACWLPGRGADAGASGDGAEGWLLDGWRGSPRSSAPEVAYGQRHNGSCDVWGLGVVTFSLATLHLVGPSLLVDGKSVVDPAKADADMRASEVPAVLQDLVRRMLVVDPKVRLSLGEVKAHPYFEGIDWGALQRGEVAHPDWRVLLGPNRKGC